MLEADGLKVSDWNFYLYFFVVLAVVSLAD